MSENKNMHIGIDIIEIDRIASVLGKYPVRFLEKIFTEYEKNYCRGRPAQLAARFASKEAFSKSIGTGISNSLNFKDIIIKNDKTGKPFFHITKKIKSIIKKKFKVTKFNFILSISDEKNYSIAFVIFQKK